MAIAGEQDVPLENKESVEILQGLAGVESGVASGAGLIDYVTKPPDAVVKHPAIDLATDHRGTAYGAVDLGRFFGAAKISGWRAREPGGRARHPELFKRRRWMACRGGAGRAGRL